ncbi:MAG TPA: hypothetical protein VND91_02750 [Candidatus Saccharimonadia bacterium]|nr:hypothetical protein [Candidatus Saccharimonadia bacterium]
MNYSDAGARRRLAVLLAPLFAIVAGTAHATADTAKGFLSLQLQGRAFTAAGPLVGATVTGFGGVPSAPVLTNATGDFTVTVNFSSTTSLARLSVRGAGAQSQVELVSIPGPHSALAAAAGDTTLDRTEDPYVDLTPHTTGVNLAMRAIDPMADEAGWQRARRSFAAEDSAQRTYIVGALADGLVPLPAGATTSLEGAATLASAQATQDLMFGPSGGPCLTTPICNMVAQLSAPPALPAKTAFNDEYRAYFPFRSENDQLAALTLATGGTGGVVTAQQRTPIVWLAIGDYLRVHRADDGPMASFTAFTSPPCSGDPDVRTVFDTVAYRVRQIAGPGGSVLLQYGEEVRTTYPDTPACTTTTTTTDPTRYVRTAGASQVPVPIADPTGKTVVLPVCETACAAAPVNGFVVNRVMEPHRFDTGGVGAQLRLGRSFTWALVGGRLTINYADGHSASVTQVSDERPGVGTAVARYIDATGVHLLATGPIVAKDPAASFGTDMESAAGIYESRINRQIPFASINSSSETRTVFGFVFTPDGFGKRIDTFGFYRWTLDAPDRIQHDSFFNATYTTMRQRRFWELIHVDGDQLLVLENLFLGPSFPAAPAPTHRLFVYLRSDIAPAASAPEPPAPLATPGDAGDAAGTAVASSGEFVVIGAPNAAVGGVDAGAVYVYRNPLAARPEAGKDVRTHYEMKDLTLVATLIPPAPTIGDKWGASVTISPDGTSIAIGSPGMASTGAVALFAMPTGGWTNGLTPGQMLTPPAIPGVVVDDFGAAIAMTPQGTLAVGAPGSSVGATTGAGIASVYTPNGSGFNAPQQIMPGTAQSGAAFGTSVAASDALLAIGAPNQDDAAGNRDSGAVHAYMAPAPGSNFNFAATLSLPGLDSIGNKFGTGVAVDGTTLVIGAPFADTGRGNDTGSAYVYEGTGGLLPATPTTQLLPQGVEGDGSGHSVATLDGVVVLGAPFATRGGRLASGAAFVFRRPGASWSEEVELTSERELGPAQTQANQRFGSSLAVSKDLLVTGSPNRDRGANTDQGETDAFALDRIFGASFE